MHKRREDHGNARRRIDGGRISASDAAAQAVALRNGIMELARRRSSPTAPVCVGAIAFVGGLLTTYGADASFGSLVARPGRPETQAKTKYFRTVSTTSHVPFMPGSITNTSPAFRWMGCSPSGVMMQ